jgi:hypothetical protein
MQLLVVKKIYQPPSELSILKERTGGAIKIVEILVPGSNPPLNSVVKKQIG